MELKQKRNRIRWKIKRLNERRLPRVCIHKTEAHMYGQVIDYNGNVLAHAATNSKEFKNSGLKSYNKEGATFLGKLLGEKVKTQKIKELVFDRSGYVYHGRVQCFADGMREFVKI